jgi:hypothetical protein
VQIANRKTRNAEQQYDQGGGANPDPIGVYAHEKFTLPDRG